MPATTTAVNARNAVISLDNSIGVLTDISGSSNKVEIRLDQDLGAFKVFGDDWNYRLEGGKDASVSLQIVYTTDATEARALLEDWFATGGLRTLQIDVPNGSVGGRRYTGEMRLESLSIPLASDEAGPIMVSVELKPHGAFLPDDIV